MHVGTPFSVECGWSGPKLTQPNRILLCAQPWCIRALLCERRRTSISVRGKVKFFLHEGFALDHYALNACGWTPFSVECGWSGPKLTQTNRILLCAQPWCIRALLCERRRTSISVRGKVEFFLHEGFA